MADRLSDDWWRIRFPLEAALEKANEPGRFVLLEEEERTDGRHRYAQALVLEKTVRLECVGPLDAAPTEAGLWPMTDVQLGRLLASGWSLAGPEEYPNLWRLHRRGYVGETAKIMAEALDALGCDPNAAWSTTVDTMRNPSA